MHLYIYIYKEQIYKEQCFHKYLKLCIQHHSIDYRETRNMHIHASAPSPHSERMELGSKGNVKLYLWSKQCFSLMVVFFSNLYTRKAKLGNHLQYIQENTVNSANMNFRENAVRVIEIVKICFFDCSRISVRRYPISTRRCIWLCTLNWLLSTLYLYIGLCNF